MICRGTSSHRRIGRHRFSLIGRAMAYGKRLLQIQSCIYCDATRVIG